jgi:4-carboxymuconolactone decarboxylase
MTRINIRLAKLTPILLGLTLLCPPIVSAQDRMPAIASDRLTPEQVAAIEELRRTRGIELRGPWIPLLRSPEVLSRARAMGDYLRYDSALPPELSEFLILLTARQWRQQYEWQAHHDIALEAGLPATTATAIAEGRRPDELSIEQATLYELFTELHSNHSVSDATYAAAVSQLGERGVIDAVSIVGYYTLLAMVMNTARTSLPEGAKAMLPSLP